MALTMSPATAVPVRQIRSPLLISEGRMDNGQVPLALRGVADASTRPVGCGVLSRVIARGPANVVIGVCMLGPVNSSKDS
jgi:hypothetical protein